jgi:hypothetical protein
MQFGRGIARGGQEGIAQPGFPIARTVDLPRNDQDVFIGGFSMMFTINR